MANRRRRNKKWISWLIFLILLIAAVVVCVLVWNSYFKPKDDEQQQSADQTVVDDKKEEKQADNKTEEQKDPDAQPEEKKVEQYDGSNPNKSAGITGVITYAGVSGDNLMIRVNIDQYLNSGTCTLALRQGGGNAYNAVANVIDSASTSTCEGFNVPVSGFPAGKYNIIIYIESGDKTGEIAGEVTL